MLDKLKYIWWQLTSPYPYLWEDFNWIALGVATGIFLLIGFLIIK